MPRARRSFAISVCQGGNGGEQASAILCRNKARSRSRSAKSRVSSLAHALLFGFGMKHKTRFQFGDEDARAKQTVLVIGGSGGMSDRYRDVVAKHGWELRHFENRVPAGARHGVGRVALVVVMVSMVSHSLREQVKSLADQDAPVVYLRSASISALRSAVEKMAA